MSEQTRRDLVVSGSSYAVMDPDLLVNEQGGFLRDFVQDVLPAEECAPFLLSLPDFDCDTTYIYTYIHMGPDCSLRSERARRSKALAQRAGGAGHGALARAGSEGYPQRCDSRDEAQLAVKGLVNHLAMMGR